MSRSGYSDDYDFPELYRANVERAIHGKQGQQFFREMADAMDAMPEKALIAEELINADGQCCAIGTVCKARGIDVSSVDYWDPAAVAKAVGISRALAAEIEFENDESWYRTTETVSEPEARWIKMRKWIDKNLDKTNLAVEQKCK